MALPASGAISLSAVNTELGLSATAAITMNDAAVRSLFGVASGAIDMNTGYGKSNRVGTVVTWPTNYLGGSQSTQYSVANLGALGNSLPAYNGTPLKAGKSMSFTINITGVLGPRVLYNGTYLYWYLVLSTYTLNSDGTPNVPFTMNWPYWYGGQSAASVYVTGINGSDTANAISWCLYRSVAGTKAAGGYDVNVRISTSANGNSDGAGYYSSYPTSQTFTVTNNSATDYWIGSYNGYNGHYTPIVLYYYNTSNQWQTYNGSTDTSSFNIYGLPLISTLTINGTAVTYRASEGANQASAIAGWKAAINAAGISGVSAVDQTNGLGIIGATTVTHSASQTNGASNYTPTIGSYGAF